MVSSKLLGGLATDSQTSSVNIAAICSQGQGASSIITSWEPSYDISNLLMDGQTPMGAALGGAWNCIRQYRLLSLHWALL